MLKPLQRIKCFLSLFMVTCITVLTPFAVLADGLGDDTPQDDQIVFSYWNLDYILAERQDGVRVLFDFPTDFYFSSSITEETINIKGRVNLSTGSEVVEDELVIRFYTASIGVVPYVFMDITQTFSTYAYVNYELGWINNIIHQTNDISYSVVSNTDIYVPYFRFQGANDSDITSSVVTSFESRYNTVIPRNNYPLSYEYSFGSYSSLMSYNVTGDAGTPLNYYALIMPQSQLDSIQASFGSRGYPTYMAVPHIDYATTKISTDYYAVQNSTLQLMLPLGFCQPDQAYSAGAVRVSLWYDLFNSYAQPPVVPSPEGSVMPADVAVGAINFISNCFSAIFSIELFPQIFVGGLVLVAFVCLAVFVILRFYAGG